MSRQLCAVEGCTNTDALFVAGYCEPHYQRMWRGKDMAPPVQPARSRRRPARQHIVRRVTSRDVVIGQPGSEGDR